RVQLGDILLALGRDVEAVEQFKQAAALGATSASRQSLITGLIRARRGQEAVAVFRSSIPKDSRSFEHWDGLAELCLFVGAGEEYEAARKSRLETFGWSRDPVVCEKLCRAAMLAPIAEKEKLAANAAIDRALDAAESRPTRRDPYLRLAKALAEYRSGRPDAA